MKDLIEIKRELEERTNYTFESGISPLGDSCLYLQGLDKKCNISLQIGTYSVEPFTDFISVHGQRKYGSYEGFSSPCDSLEEVIEVLDREASRFGYVEEPKQLSFI